jgi:DNA polymerase III sliding clamp (beta) subunit (PCNA family)
MRYLIYLTIFIVSFWNNEFHDLPIGYFRMYELDSLTMMNITLDAEDVAKAISKTVTEINLQDFQKYINENTNWKFDDKKVLVMINQVNLEQDHLKAIGYFEGENLCAKNLYISNRILLEVANQSNIIEINRKDQTMDFHMNKKRTEIRVSLGE